MSETNIDAFVTDVADLRQAIVNLVVPLRKINIALKEISENQSYLNGRINEISNILKFSVEFVEIIILKKFCMR